MRRWRCPSAAVTLTTALLLGGLPGGARAQQAPAPASAPAAPAGPAPTPAAPSAFTPAEVCALEPVLVSVSLGGQGRGDVVARIGAGRYYVPSDTLQGSEVQYVRARIDCDDGSYIELDPRLRPVFDPLSQLLRLQPVLALLPGNTLDFREVQGLTPAASLGTTGLDFGLRLNGTLGQGAAGTAYLGLGYASGRFAGYGGGILTAAADGLGGFSYRAAPRAVLRYSPSPLLDLTAAYNATPEVLGVRGDLLRFQGLRVDARSSAQLYFPDITLDLLLDADIQVNVNGRQLRSFRASAGTLRLLSIPFQGYGASLDLLIDDGVAPRVKSYSYLADARSLRPGAYLAGVQAGYQDSQLALSGRGVVGLGRSLTLDGDAALLGDRYTASANLQYVDDRNTATLGAVVSGQLPSSPVASPAEVPATPGVLNPEVTPDARVLLRYARVVTDHLNLRLSTSVPVLRPADLNLSAGAAYSQAAWTYQLEGGYDFGLKAPTFGAGVSYNFSSGQTASLNVSRSPAGWRASLSTNLSPLPNLQATLNAQVDDSATTSTGTATTPGSVGSTSDSSGLLSRVRPTLELRYRPNSTSTVTAAAGLSSASAAYLYTGRVRASVAASTLKTYSAALDGAVSITEGRLTLSQGLGARSIYVHTGVAGVPLLINGVGVGTTDARGDVLISQLPADEYVTLTIDVNALPFNYSVRDERATLRLPAYGTAVLDWTGNIVVSRYLQFFWTAGEPASYGTLRVGALAYPLDDQGNGLIATVPDGTVATLKSDDGQRSCAVVLRATQDRVVCQP